MGRRPGRPDGGRLGVEIRQGFWDALRGGASVRDATAAAGVSVPAGYQWLRQAGGVLPRKRAEPDASSRLGFAERCQIEELRLAGYQQSAIARLLGRSRSTISREVARCGGLAHYRAVAAHGNAERARQRPKPRRLASNPRLLAAVLAGLQRRRSPQQIANRLRRDFPDDPEMRVSHETIYQAIYVQPRGELARQIKAAIRDGKVLRTGRTQRKPHGRTARTSPITDPISISERPAEANDRAVPGHWEGDLIIGANGKSAIGTLVERTTGFVLLLHLPHDHTAASVAQAISTTITTLPQALHRSLTWDRGGEMARHKQITATTGIPIYFADPHSPWQRGSNENTNGLLRQYFPKGTDLTIHDQAELQRVAEELNTRPRRRHDWETPAEVLARLLSNHEPVATTP